MMNWDFGSILTFLLIMAIYLLPELLKRKKSSKEYEYPEIPDGAPLPDTKRPIDIKPPPGAKPAPAPATKPTVKPFPGPDFKLPPDIPQPATAIHTAVPTTVKHEHKGAAHGLPPAAALPAMSDASPWSSALDQNIVWNGVIFAEILQPPRAYRPFRQRRFPGGGGK